MKKLLCVLLAVLMLVPALVSCGNKTVTTDAGTDAQGTGDAAETAEEVPELPEGVKFDGQEFVTLVSGTLKYSDFDVDQNDGSYEAVNNAIERRNAEGSRLESSIYEKIANIKEYLKEIEKNSESDTAGYAKKLEDRILKFLNDNSVQIDEQRILTEVAIFADKIAIDEELVRLGSHFVAFDEIVNSNEPAGRKLDFLLQEMNRETNTIGSKASNTETAHLVVNIKNELEKIREQVQNIE
jgi:uncharacterized protein (TIGR00255 family)